MRTVGLWVLIAVWTAGCEGGLLAKEWPEASAAPFEAELESGPLDGGPLLFDGPVWEQAQAAGSGRTEPARAEPSATAQVTVQESACAPEMVLIEGQYCPQVEQRCLQWLDEGAAFLPHHRCARFEVPSRCLSGRVQMRFCIDRDEYTEPGQSLPANYQSWTMASKVCESLGKRLCQEAEWTFACEGEQMLPYPYGHQRDPSRCNFDLSDLVDDRGKLKDHRKVSGQLASCTSPFGVRNMVGNIDEWVWREGASWSPFRSALKGGWWMAARNRCRPATTAHDEFYNDTQTGFRCCRDAR